MVEEHSIPNGLQSNLDEETIPFTEISEHSVTNGSNNNSVEETKKVTASFCTKLKKDPIYRKNYILTVNLFSAFFILGWMVGQAGPAFMDLQIITNVTLERGSAFFTAGAAGYLFGSLLTGIIYELMQKKVFIIFITVFGLGLTTLVTPWCFNYEVMVFVKLLGGIMGGGLDTSGNTLLARTWGSDGRMFMQAIHFGFALGGTVSPLAIAPFLIPEMPSAQDPSNMTEMPLVNISQGYNLSLTFNETTTISISTNHSSVNASSSILYIGFSISALLAFKCAIPLFILFLQDHPCSNQKLKKDSKEEQEKEETRHVEMTFKMKVLVIIVLLTIFIMYCAVEDTFMSFLSTFCVRQLKWTKVKGALITSAFWGAFAFGRLSGIVLVVIFAPVTLIFLFATMELVSFAGIFASVWFDLQIGIWIFTTLLGFSMSVIFPCVFTWTEESFLKVTGVISSLFLFGACCGTSVNPILLGMIMEEYSNMWFIYLLSGEAVLLYIILFTALFLSKRIRKPRQTFQDVTVEVRSDIEDDDHRSIIEDSDLNMG